MDLTNINNVIAHADPIEMPVSELLTGSYAFSIPSYQRGYRWESSEKSSDKKKKEVKQVDDLLNDLTSFVSNKTKPHQETNYYLQPLMVKPKRTSDGTYTWDVLDGQQRLTTMLLLLTCLNQKLNSSKPLPLYSLSYANRNQLDFSKISFDTSSPNYDYPDPSHNLDSYFVRKAKDRIERWYDEELADNEDLQYKIKKLLFYPDSSRETKYSPDLRAKFIWYNVEPITSNALPQNDNESIKRDIEVFNRLNGGKISLTDSELIKALFLLCIKASPSSGSSLMTSETLVRKWDEMGKKFQNDSFWNMISPRNKEYSNRMDLLFDFIKECEGESYDSSYRFYYQQIHDLNLLSDPNPKELESLWDRVKMYFDTLCKWHEDVRKHNLIGFLVHNNTSISDIYKDKNLKKLIKECLNISNTSDIDELSYQDSEGFGKIQKILLLFNVLTCDKYGQKFPYDLYRDNSYDVEHVNSQTDNPIEKIEEKKEWIIEHALHCLQLDQDSSNKSENQRYVNDLIREGKELLKRFEENNNVDVGNKFKPYRIKVENYYASGDPQKGMANKDSIGNLTLLNSSINREYKNALFPKKLRTLKRSDQEGTYIPLCTKYMFLKYYSNPSANASTFSMMRWRTEDQNDYLKAIKDLIKEIL